MTPEAWGTNLGAIAAAGFAGWQSWQVRRRGATREQLTEVGDRATTAAKAAAQAVKDAPTANGFAPKVLTSLEKLETGQAELKADVAVVRQRLDGHIDDHASADVRRRQS